MNKRLRIIVSLICAGLLLSFGGYILYKEIELNKLSPDTVIYEDINLYPGSYEVYVINSKEITYYNFSKYWSQNKFDFFEYPLPPENQYYTKVYPIDDDQWEYIVNTLNKQKYNRIRKDLSVKGIMDGGYSYIKVISGEKSYLFGGYCPEDGYLISFIRFKKIQSAIKEVIDEAN